MMTLQEIIDQVESLSIEDQDQLFELIRKQRIENRRDKILANAHQVFKAVETGTAMRGTFEELKSYLLEDEETNSDGFWDMTLKFRQVMKQEGIIFEDDDFADLRDRSVGREVVL
jgi:hypothetical protein